VDDSTSDDFVDYVKIHDATLTRIHLTNTELFSTTFENINLLFGIILEAAEQLSV
jgi:hypothetical protein